MGNNLDGSLLGPEYASIKWEIGEMDAIRERIRIARAKLKARGLDPDLKRGLRRLSTLHPAIAPKWINDIPPPCFGEFVSMIDGLELHDRQEKVFREAAMWTPEQFMDGDRAINEIVLLWGKGSGKDWIVARFIAWVTYICLSLVGDLGPYFGLNKTDKLYIINVAPTGLQAREIFFAYLEANLRSNVFERFFPNPDKQIMRDEVRFWSSRWKIFVKRLFIFSRNSNSSGLEGYNVLAWVMDEADDFRTTQSGSKAVTIRKQFRSSAATRMGNRSVGIVISYPRTEDGFMMSLAAEVQADIADCKTRGVISSFYFDIAATWDIRPDVTLATNKVMQQDYTSDARLARAMYECIPMAAVDAFFDFPERILALSNNAREPIIDAYTEVVETEMHSGTIDQALTLLATWDKVHRQPGKVYFLTADGGLKGDGYAIAIMATDQSSNAWLWVCPECQRESPESLKQADYHAVTDVDIIPGQTIECGCCLNTPYYYHHGGQPKGWVKRSGSAIKSFCYGTKEFHLPVIQEEFVFQIDPIRPTGPGKKGIIVDFPGVFTFIEKAALILRPEQIRMDPWNHAQMLQGLKRSTHMDVDEMSFSNTDQFKRARLVKTLAYTGIISLLKQPRRDLQWTRLIRKGGRIDHNLGGEKDMWDAESMGIWLAACYNDRSIEFSFQ